MSDSVQPKNNVVDIRADMRRNPDGSRIAYVKELQAWHHTVLLMKSMGFTNTEIAEKTGFSSGHISTVVNSPAFRAALDRFTKARVADALDLQKELLHLAPAAIAAIGETFSDSEAKATDKLRAAFGVLDRVGAPPKVPVRENGDGEVRKHLHIHLTPDEERELRERAKRAGVQEFLGDRDESD